jgi:hypothetical protein
MNMEKNILCIYNLFCAELNNALQGKKYIPGTRTLYKNGPSIYLVVFRNINKGDKKELIYNYISYSYIFKKYLLFYFLNRGTYFSIANFDYGNKLVFVDPSIILFF